MTTKTWQKDRDSAPISYSFGRPAELLTALHPLLPPLELLSDWASELASFQAICTDCADPTSANFMKFERADSFLYGNHVQAVIADVPSGARVPYKEWLLTRWAVNLPARYATPAGWR